MRQRGEEHGRAGKGIKLSTLTLHFFPFPTDGQAGVPGGLLNEHDLP